MLDLPRPLPQTSTIPEAQDVPYSGQIELLVDATDVIRGIVQVRQTLPVQPGHVVLMYPKWLPGYHAPQAPIELLAGLELYAGGQLLHWHRDQVEVYAFHVEIPDGITALEIYFQFLSPTSSAQGRISVTQAMLNLQWNTVVLYPAGYFARNIEVKASLTLPASWEFGCALEMSRKDGQTIHFQPAALDTLVDSPVFAGEHYQRHVLDENGPITLNVVADAEDLLRATPEQLEVHRQLVVQADRLFGARHFDHFDFLLALSSEMGGIGVEHHRSCETGTVESYFTGWETTFSRRDVLAHEYTHSWNGKYRRGVDSWSPSFDQPIRSSLMWVYEGQTQYWGQVLATRSGLWTPEQALGSLAHTAATYDHRPGGRWRPMSDTTRDPIIASRSPLPWTSWQRSEDYYSEGQLVWLEVDTKIRELTNNTRSLDTFARAFFGVDDGSFVTNTYDFEEVVETLGAIAPNNWEGFFLDRLEARVEGAPLRGLTQGGYELVYRDHPNVYSANIDMMSGMLNLAFSVGMSVATSGAVQEVIWDGPSFAAGITAGSQILAVNDREFSTDEFKRAVAQTQRSGSIGMTVRQGKRLRQVVLDYDEGLKFPHLAPVSEADRMLDQILAPL
ncbi:MAG: peptidase [Devosia sp.]|nr:peptidase [Devosia sp.]